jgi:hypothetical protein
MPRQFTLCSLFILTAVVAVACLPLPIKRYQIRKAADVVHAFLEAERTGDHATASELMTSGCHDRLTAHNRASYVVGRFELLPAGSLIAWDTAHVHFTWTYLDDDGQRQSDEVILHLQHETTGWRIDGAFDDGWIE